MRRRSSVLRLFLVLALFGVVSGIYAATSLRRAVIDISIKPRFTNDISPTVGVYEPEIVFSHTLTDGDAVNLAEITYCVSDSVTASGTDTIDLISATTDAFGNALAYAKLKLVYVRNKSTTAGDIINVVRPATDGAAFLGADGDLSAVGPGGVFLWFNPSAAGVAVAAGDTDNIDIVEVGGVNTVSYDFCAIGTD